MEKVWVLVMYIIWPVGGVLLHVGMPIAASSQKLTRTAEDLYLTRHTHHVVFITDMSMVSVT